MIMNPTPLSLLDRAHGMLLGLACGDSVGAAVEFRPRGSFEPVKDMIGGGKFQLEPGEWTDDTSMALCLADSLIACNGFDALDQMTRYQRWINTGYRSCKPHPIGIGKTILQSMMRFQKTGEAFAGLNDPKTAGNGALMRLAPVVLFYAHDLKDTLKAAIDSTRTTHGTDECLAASELFSEMLHHTLHGKLDKRNLYPITAKPHWPETIQVIARGDFIRKDEESIRGSGYVVESLEAALWCWFHTSSYEEAILKAVNLGDDADTTAAICGQLAGAYYGISGIPEHWLNLLVQADELQNIAKKLMKL